MNVEVGENLAMCDKKENAALKEEINDLKTSFALMKVEYEELEIKNESLQKDIVAHDDEIEEAYREKRTFQTNLSQSNSEKSKLIENIEDKDIQLSTMKKELERNRSKFKDLENVNNKNEENILMLENKLASRDQKVYELNKKITNIEDSTPITFATVCGMCESVTQKRL